MQKILISLVACFCGILAVAQTDKQLIQGYSLEVAGKKQLLAGIEQSNHLKNLRGGCDTLVTELGAGNSFNGNMFDIIPLNMITLETFSVTVDPGNFNVAIFYRNGSYVGNETSSTGWIFLDSAVITGMGDSIPVQVPVSLGLSLLPFNTYGFYVTCTHPDAIMHYTDGTTTGTLHASDANLEFYEGNGGGYPFNVTFSPRVFNGNIIYCPGPVTGINELSATLTLDVYPNPANNLLHIDLGNLPNVPVCLTIYDALGKNITTQPVSGGTMGTLRLEDWMNGVYSVHAVVEGRVLCARFMVLN